MNDIVNQTKNGAIMGATAGAITVTATFVLAVAGSIYTTLTDECRNEGCGNIGPLQTVGVLVVAAYTWNAAHAIGALAGATIGGTIGFTKGCVHYFFNTDEPLENGVPPLNDPMNLLR